MTIAGIVLAGGKSSRYGNPKMFETYNDKYFYEHSVDALMENALSPIIIATNTELIPHFHRNDVKYICENAGASYQGPLYAIANVMNSVPDANWFFILSCDTPFITSQFVSEMISYTNNNKLDAIVPIQSDRIQPLLALYHRRCLKEMQRLLAKNKRKIGLLFDTINVLTVPFSKNDNVFVNINYKKDWYNQ